MSLPFDPTFLSLSAGVAVAGLLIGFVVLLSYHVCAADHPPAEADYAPRRCRYCHWGSADMIEESMQVDGEDIVAVRLYGCRRCGMPQWFLDRTPVLRHVGR